MRKGSPSLVPISAQGNSSIAGHQAAAGQLAQTPRTREVIGMDRRVDGVIEFQTHRLQDRCIACRAIQHRVNQCGYAAVRATDSVQVLESGSNNCLKIIAPAFLLASDCLTACEP